MQSSNSTNVERVLFVDLDDSLIATDIMVETIVAILKKSPWKLIALLGWLFRGKVYFKHQLVKHALPDFSTIPVHQSVLDFLIEEKRNGREIVLATASVAELANPMAERFGMFDSVICTTDNVNIGGAYKLDLMRKYAGSRAFDYIGDRAVDIPIWRECATAIAVNPSSSLRAKYGSAFGKEFYEKQTTLKSYLRSLRVHQWVKNVLLFVPLIMAHKLHDTATLLVTLCAFFAFSFFASAVYVLNDILDVENDRLHPTKRKRPFASGEIPLWHGALLIPILLGSSILLSLLFLPSLFTIALCLYGLVTTVYSLYAKKIPIVDVLLLAGLYSFRIFSGGFASQVPLSPWLLAFSLFFFLSLAFVKRYTELLSLVEQNKVATKGRGYVVSDMELLRSVGPASGYLAVLVLALYTNSNVVSELYNHPLRLWLLEPLMLYWITRVWFLAHRGEMHDDPIVFALKDVTSYVVLLLVACVVVVASI